MEKDTKCNWYSWSDGDLEFKDNTMKHVCDW